MDTPQFKVGDQIISLLKNDVSFMNAGTIICMDRAYIEVRPANPEYAWGTKDGIWLLTSDEMMPAGGPW